MGVASRRGVDLFDNRRPSTSDRLIYFINASNIDAYVVEGQNSTNKYIFLLDDFNIFRKKKKEKKNYKS